MASIASAASIACINVDELRIQTGVDTEEIEAFIRGPDKADGKWWCGWAECDKRFGRKENIKSHVQTHLNDRQYQCPTCHKCFVRQHDLKRHAKIHTGVKPYLCDCGNGFARHDALTRHRQRGMCIGAFDGVVRKVVKRGRPRKVPPDVSARAEHRKAARVRRRNNLSISSVSSSISGYCYSDSSNANSPPPPTSDEMLIDPYRFDLMTMGVQADMGIDLDMDLDMEKVQSSFAMDHAHPADQSTVRSESSAPMPVMSSDAAAPSPSARSQHSFISPDELMEPPHCSLPQLLPAASHTTPAAAASSPCKSTTSQYTTPPELSQSSSSPPPCGRFFDLDLPVSHNPHDDDDALLFHQALAVADGDLLMMGKMDDDFDRAFSLFTNDDQVYFANA